MKYLAISLLVVLAVVSSVSASGFVKVDQEVPVLLTCPICEKEYYSTDCHVCDSSK